MPRELESAGAGDVESALANTLSSSKPLGAGSAGSESAKSTAPLKLGPTQNNTATEAATAIVVAMTRRRRVLLFRLARRWVRLTGVI